MKLLHGLWIFFSFRSGWFESKSMLSEEKRNRKKAGETNGKLFLMLEHMMYILLILCRSPHALAHNVFIRSGCVWSTMDRIDFCIAYSNRFCLFKDVSCFTSKILLNYSINYYQSVGKTELPWFVYCIHANRQIKSEGHEISLLVQMRKCKWFFHTLELYVDAHQWRIVSKLQ